MAHGAPEEIAGEGGEGGKGNLETFIGRSEKGTN